MNTQEIHKVDSITARNILRQYGLDNESLDSLGYGQFSEWLNKQTKDRKQRIDKDGIRFADKNYLFNQLEFNNNNDLSVQASEFHYCEPKKFCETGSDYECVEVFGSKSVSGLECVYCHDDECTHPYVDIETMEVICILNGGIKNAV